MICCKSGFWDPWDRFNLVRIQLSSKLPQELLREIIEYCLGNEYQTFGEMDFNNFCKKSYVIVGLEEIVYGKMTVMTVGSFHAFIKIMTSTGALHVRVHIFTKTHISIFSV